jgi:hypothetical protein
LFRVDVMLSEMTQYEPEIAVAAKSEVVPLPETAG